MKTKLIVSAVALMAMTRERERLPAALSALVRRQFWRERPSAQ